ncbi:hypothetical protein PG994_005196 [Apiospora phragmitis]|uniref:DUF7580 domain-containing protein n=1 Tax=Apiospora phragmitis TaxID=2905665 RepID=A0ABR1VSV4_9PEZI
MSALSLAIRAIKRLQGVVDDLRAQPACLQFCESLKIILIDLLKCFRSLPEDKHSENEASALLERLDKLCRLQNTPAQPAPPSVALDGGSSCVALLLAESESVVWAIRDVASNPQSLRQRKTTLASLKAFLPEDLEQGNIDISPSDTDLRSIGDEPPECGREIRSLHAALSAQCLCTDSDEMLARIRLRSTLEGDSANITFGMVFMAHPHRTQTDLPLQPLWQDTDFDTGSGIDYEEIRSDSGYPFCSYISAQDEHGIVMLKFTIRGRKLYFEDTMELSSYCETDKPSVSLGQLLEGISASGLTEKRKEVLSWPLAKSIWQYYNSPWMQQPWNKESVHFLLERRHDEDGHDVAGIFVNEPLLSVSIGRRMQASGGDTANESGPGTVKREPDAQRRRSPFLSRPRHPIPKMLALGMMLVEIQLGQPIETLYSQTEWSKYCPQGKENQNTDHRICKDLIGKKHFFEDISDPLEAP